VHRGAAAPGPAVEGSDAHVELTLPRDEACGWIAANVRDTAGKALLIGNPIYIECR